MLPLGVMIGWLPVASLLLGYASHLVEDACTKTGIAVLYQNSKRYHLLPAGICIVTGSEYEELFFVFFQSCLLLCC